MSAENKLAVFKSGDVGGLWPPVCAEAEWRYFRWLAFLLTTSQRLAIKKGLFIDRRLNIFQARFAQKDHQFGRRSLILLDYEIPMLSSSSYQTQEMMESELGFWLEAGVSFRGFSEPIFSLAIREVWGNPITMPFWYFEGCEVSVDSLPDQKLSDGLKSILKRRDEHWMLESIKLLFLNLEKVEIA